MLSCDNLVLKVNDRILANGIGFTLFPGTILNIIGDNSSGKTTLLKTLATLNDGFEQSLYYNNINILDCFEKYRSLISYMGHDSFLFEDLTVIENLEFWAKIHGRELTIAPVSMVFDLYTFFDKKIKHLSAGTRKKILLTILLLSNSNIWLLDEPFSNLDDKSVKILLNILQAKSQQNGIVILTSHNNISLVDIVSVNLMDYKK